MTSEHFTDAELRCPCCGVNSIQPDALDLAESIRATASAKLGTIRLIVTSGYRCESHNAAIGGAPRSQHVQGLALDLRLELQHDGVWTPVQPSEWEPIARLAPKLGGIGRDDERGFIHVDARPRFTSLPAQWCYHAGREVAYYKPKQPGTSSPAAS